MEKQLRRYALGALAAGTLVAGVAVTPRDGRDAPAAWVPVTSGLTTSPDDLLPERISAAEPVRVVSTALDADGRPVVTAREATDRAAASDLVRAGQRAPGAVGVELDAPVTLQAVPTGGDTYRGSQWDFAKLSIAATWPASTGEGVTVAVIDTGVDAGHPDLAGQVLPGLDLVTDTAGTSSDAHGHGTHVAGTIAAATGNDTGISGIAPGARILPVRTLDANGSGVMSDLATAIVYAADQGARVINMSLGATVQVTAVTNAIGYARSKGVVLVAAAGNYRSSGSPTMWPAADPGVVAVASTDSADAYSSFSNRGSYVDVAAPGTSILSTIPVAKGGYSYFSGTSMASPHVAAVAALIRAYRPGLDPDAVEGTLTGTAVDLGTAGFDTDYGHGRINPVAALAAVAPSTPAPVSSAPAAAPVTDPQPSTAPSDVPSGTPTSSAPTAVPTSSAPTAGPTSSGPTAVPTSAPVLVTPVITVAGGARDVDHGTTTSTLFSVTAAGRKWSGRPASVCVAPTGAGFTCTATTTSSAGTVRYARTTTGGYQVRLMVAATATSAAAVSATHAYLPRAVVKLRKSGSRAATATIAGASGQPARLQAFEGGSWATVQTFPATATRTVSGLRPGTRYRLVVTDTPAVAGAQSTVLTM